MKLICGLGEEKKGKERKGWASGFSVCIFLFGLWTFPKMTRYVNASLADLQTQARSPRFPSNRLLNLSPRPTSSQRARGRSLALCAAFLLFHAGSSKCAHFFGKRSKSSKEALIKKGGKKRERRRESKAGNSLFEPLTDHNDEAKIGRASLWSVKGA